MPSIYTMQNIDTFPTPDHTQESYDWFKEMRETNPVRYDEETNQWHVFRYEDTLRVLTDYETFSSEERTGVDRDNSTFAESIIALDPPRHRQLRGIISQAFTPKAVAQLAPRITEIVQALLDTVRSRGKIDLIGDLSYHLPTTVIAQMLGVPSTDRPMFKRWADDLMIGQLNTNPLRPVDAARQRRRVAAIQAMSDYFLEQIAERRRRPRLDMISSLIAAEIDGAYLTERQLVGFCNLLLVAGHVTTTYLLGNAVYCLDAYPEAMQLLHTDPTLVHGTIEEVLRFLPSVWHMPRKTKTAVTISGQIIPAKQFVRAWIASANRDPEQFPEPDVFDIRRKPNRHLGFGHGIHICIGAPLARLETTIALPMIIQQLPNLQRVRDIPMEPIESSLLYGVKFLPITFTTVDS